MDVGDRVILTTPDQVFMGTVTMRRDDGMCSVKWDAGLTERIHESEVRPLGAPLYPKFENGEELPTAHGEPID